MAFRYSEQLSRKTAKSDLIHPKHACFNFRLVEDAFLTGFEVVCQNLVLHIKLKLLNTSLVLRV